VGKTSIEWTDQSWPIVNGCRRKSPGCENCYAERLISTRLRRTPKYEGLAVYGKNGPRWTGKARLWPADLSMPIRVRQPARIFVADMGDLFYEEVPDEVIAVVFGVMALACHHTYQVLTKRADRMQALLSTLSLEACIAAAVRADVVCTKRQSKAIRDALPADSPFRSNAEGSLWPLPNVWIGVSVEDQARANERIPALLDTPAAVRFLSIEPQLGPIDLTRIDAFRSPPWPASLPGEPKTYLDALRGTGLRPSQFGVSIESDLGRHVDWVIVGGESGPGARAFDIAWARSVVAQCREAQVPAFVKQLGAHPIRTTDDDDLESPPGLRHQLPLRDRKGAAPSEWPADLRVREMPNA
jgi:protein gp37